MEETAGVSPGTQKLERDYSNLLLNVGSTMQHASAASHTGDCPTLAYMR